jgi:hypothetical protein
MGLGKRAAQANTAEGLLSVEPADEEANGRFDDQLDMDAFQSC